MKRDYSKWCSVALIVAIYALAGLAGWLLFEGLATNPLTTNPLIRLFLTDVLATIIVWASLFRSWRNANSPINPIIPSTANKQEY